MTVPAGTMITESPGWLVRCCCELAAPALFCSDDMGVGRRLLVCETTEKAAEPAVVPGWLLPVQVFSGITVCIREPRLWMIKIAWSGVQADAVVVTLPVEIDMTNADSVGSDLSAALGPGVAVVVAVT